jgi:ABC-type branched-subunit amino acid transport system substrate-binding protein
MVDTNKCNLRKEWNSWTPAQKVEFINSLSQYFKAEDILTTAMSISSWEELGSEIQNRLTDALKKKGGKHASEGSNPRLF